MFVYFVVYVESCRLDRIQKTVSSVQGGLEVVWIKMPKFREVPLVMYNLFSCSSDL